jgi:hypothetical protein
MLILAHSVHAKPPMVNTTPDMPVFTGMIAKDYLNNVF